MKKLTSRPGPGGFVREGTEAGRPSKGQMGQLDPSDRAGAFSLEHLLRELRVTRVLSIGRDPRRLAREAGPDVGRGLPHRGERRLLRED